jgi:hypothetical protein
MTQATRLDLELADALGATQAVRAAVEVAAGRVHGDKLWRRLASIDADLAPLQEQVNELVVADRGTRTRLTGRARRVRDADADGQPGEGEGDAIDAMQALASQAAYALAQWQVVRRLAKAAGNRPAHQLAKRALPLASEHLETALACCDRVARREAEALTAG